MKTLIKNLALVLVVGIVACKSNNKENAKDIYQARIDTLESKLKKAQAIDNMNAVDLIAAYSTYAENFPNDSIAPDYLFKAGEVASSVKQGQKAINIFKMINEKYPNYDKAHYCLFLQAFIYETQLNNNEKAKEIYNQVIEKYPNERIAEDAKACIQNLGKSDEELIREFEEKNKQAS